MTKVTGAAMIGLTACTTHLSVVEHTHAWVKQASNLRLRSFIGSLRGNLHDRTAFNLLRGKDAELDAHDGLDIRRMLMKSVRHSVLEGEVVLALDSSTRQFYKKIRFRFSLIPMYDIHELLLSPSSSLREGRTHTEYDILDRV